MTNYSKMAGRSVVAASAFGKTNNAHPGQNMGLSLEQVKKLVDNAQKVKGTSFTSIAGTTQPNVQIPATAKYIVGFSFAGTITAADTFNLIINNERAIDTGSVQAYQVNTGKPEKAYYDFFRPVASATAINIEYTSAVAGSAVVFQLIYI